MSRLIMFSKMAAGLYALFLITRKPIKRRIVQHSVALITNVSSSKCRSVYNQDTVIFGPEMQNYMQNWISYTRKTSKMTYFIILCDYFVK